MYRSTVTLALLLSAVQTAMGSSIIPDVSEFFKESIEGNLTKITWEHAVNSQEKLNASLSNPDIQMLEADIVMGTLNGTNNTIPIMAHPPAIISDLSLEMFLTSVIKNGAKGIKLDFKSIDVFNGSKTILNNTKVNITFPVWLNADILQGPVNSNSTPVDAKSFLSGAHEIFPDSTLSIGWTTRYGTEYNITEGSYSQENIEQMIETITNNSVKQPITFPLRAGLAANSALSDIQKLMNSTAENNSTLTIWSSTGDEVDGEKLSTLIKTIGVDKVYVDVPDEVWENLNLSSGASNLRMVGLTVGLVAVLSQIMLKLFSP